MARSGTSWTLRILRRLLVSGRGEVRALEDAIHLAGVLRFVALLAATIVLPALLLAYFGFSSIRVEQLDLMADVQREASAVADAFWSNTDRSFAGLEDRVRDRLEAGRSPLESHGELHPHLLVALRFDQSGQLVAPFVVGSHDVEALSDDLFDSAMLAAVQAERSDQDSAAVARRYLVASRKASTRQVEGRALFDRARVLMAAGRQREAGAVIDDIVDRYPNLRDPWGFRLGDLARLERGEMLLGSSPSEGAVELRVLVDDLLGARWTVGQGGEAAIARRALSLLEPVGERERTAVTRGRLAERTAMLYWTGQLLPELQSIVGSNTGLRVDPGRFRWRDGETALWATTWWDGDFYAFGLDRAAVTSGLKADARGSVLPDAVISAYLVGPDERMDQDVLVEKSLAPWLTGWSLVVVPRDPDALMATQARKRNQRLGVILLSLLLIAVGAFLSALLVKRELDVARMKADFASNVSHELRSPITQIRLKGESLLFGLAETPEELEAAYQAIVRESERLSRLVDNVLDFGAIERGAKSYTLRPVDIRETVYRAVDSISSAQEVKDKVIDLDLPSDLPVVHHDPDAVAQCVINLVSNAAKYSEPGSGIGIRGQVVDEFVDIDVIDKGIGIAPHDVEHIFEPFFRSRGGAARRRKGTGIGLTITRYIMHAHGGQVIVQSRLGRGSTFSLRFPLKPPPDAVLGSPLGRGPFSPNTGA